MSEPYGFDINRRPASRRRSFCLMSIPVVELDELIGIDGFLWDGHDEAPDAWRPAWWHRLEAEWMPYNMGLSNYG